MINRQFCIYYRSTTTTTSTTSSSSTSGIQNVNSRLDYQYQYIIIDYSTVFSLQLRT